MSVKELLDELGNEDTIFRYSGGGITLSGGEPLLQAEFASEFLKACHQNGWNTAIETTGYGSKEAVLSVIPECDYVLMDFKHADDAIHRKYTGVGTAVIHQNAELINTMGKYIIGRVPVIPGFNASEEAIEQLAVRMAKLSGIKEVQLLPYHRFGLSKYEGLNQIYKIPLEVKAPDKEQMEQYKKIMEYKGLTCCVGGQ